MPPTSATTYMVAQSPLALAKHFMAQEMPLEALPHYREAMRTAPRASLVYDFGIILHQQGLLEEEAELYETAVRNGVWEHPRQRPLQYIWGLKAQPWWDASDLEPARELEQCYPVIKSELIALLEAERFAHYTSPAVVAGEWKDYVLFANGEPALERCDACPETVAAVKKIPGATSQSKGNVYFSYLAPGTHIRSHCGPTNSRLRIHLGLIVPTAPNTPKLRVCDETREWEEGKCLVFDDSFEHEVWNYDEHRVVLVVDMWHPELETAEQQYEALTTPFYE